MRPLVTECFVLSPSHYFDFKPSSPSSSVPRHLFINLCFNCCFCKSTSPLLMMPTATNWRPKTLFLMSGRTWLESCVFLSLVHVSKSTTSQLDGGGTQSGSFPRSSMFSEVYFYPSSWLFSLGMIWGLWMTCNYFNPLVSFKVEDYSCVNPRRFVHSIRKSDMVTSLVFSCISTPSSFAGITFSISRGSQLKRTLNRFQLF